MRHPHGTTSRTARALRTSAAGAVSATLVAGTALGLAPAAQAASGTTGAPTTRFVDIKGYGGTVLKANVVAPADASRAYPLLVLPTSWGLPQVEYLAQAQKLADAGYVVVSYNVRGFWESGGYIEVAGPPDMADASKVIDWALANTPADAGHIGMAGLSYGAGISLLTAAQDKRVKAVAALSGWADLIDSIYGGRTQHLQAAALLDGAGRITGRQGPELQQIFKDFYASNLDKEGDMIAWGRNVPPRPTWTSSTPTARRSCSPTPGATPSSRPTSTPTSTRSSPARSGWSCGPATTPPPR